MVTVAPPSIAEAIGWPDGRRVHRGARLGLSVLIVVRSAGIGAFLAFALLLFLAAWIAARFRGGPILAVAAAFVGLPGVI